MADDDRDLVYCIVLGSHKLGKYFTYNDMDGPARPEGDCPENDGMQMLNLCPAVESCAPEAEQGLPISFYISITTRHVRNCKMAILN